MLYVTLLVRVVRRFGLWLGISQQVSVCYRVGALGCVAKAMCKVCLGVRVSIQVLKSYTESYTGSSWFSSNVIWVGLGNR